MSLRVAIAFDQGALEEGAYECGPEEAAAEETVAELIKQIQAALASRGHTSFAFGLSGNRAEMFHALATVEADVIFNLVESYRGRAAYEAAARGALELTGIPVTGAPVEALANCLVKPRTRALLTAAGVPIPRGWVITGDEARDPGLVYPCIVKPSAQDASHGIDQSSICRDFPAVLARAKFLAERELSPVLVEEFIEGREFNISMMEAIVLGERVFKALPIAEIDFSGYPEGAARILTFAAKWDDKSVEYKGSVSVEAKTIAPELRAELTRVATLAFEFLGLRDYGRVDFRVSRDGKPYVVDVNPNPDISRGAGFHLATQRDGRTYEDAIETIVANARARLTVL